MPRPLPLDENLVADRDRCETCGALLVDETPDREEHSDLEIVRRLALLASDDWKAATVMLLYVAHPNATIGYIAGKIRIERQEVCEARDRAAEKFPSLDGILALKTPRAIAQTERRLAERKDTAQTDLF